jgi:glutathione S-transferase
MNPPILHHYPTSPFSEKVRLVFGAKGIAWHSVQIPVIMPKPDVIALTGGYRKTPILQIGADVYCDTALICKLLDVLHPEPPLYPQAVAGTAQMLAQWADSTLFWTAVPYTARHPAGIATLFGESPEVLKAFAADRASFAANTPRLGPVDGAVAMQHYLGWLESHLAAQGTGGGWLLGETLSIADFSVAHALWFMRLAPAVGALLEGYPKLVAWLERVLAFGHGTSMPMQSGAAVELAAAATEHAPVQLEAGLGFESGEAVNVSATDYGSDPVAGSLVGLTRDSVTIERRDARAGRVHVHFPRLGFQIRKGIPA